MLPRLAMFCVLFLSDNEPQTKMDSDTFQKSLTLLTFFKGSKSSLKEVDPSPRSGPCLLVKHERTLRFADTQINKKLKQTQKF